MKNSEFISHDSDLSTRRLVFRRLLTDWRLMLSVFLGIMVATLLMSAAPVYLDALERQSINSAVESALARDGEVYFSITSRSNFIPLEVREIERTGAALDQAVLASVAEIHTGTERHLRTPFYAVVLPVQPSREGRGRGYTLTPALSLKGEGE